MCATNLLQFVLTFRIRFLYDARFLANNRQIGRFLVLSNTHTHTKSSLFSPPINSVHKFDSIKHNNEIYDNNKAFPNQKSKPYKIIDLALTKRKKIQQLQISSSYNKLT